MNFLYAFRYDDLLCHITFKVFEGCFRNPASLKIPSDKLMHLLYGNCARYGQLRSNQLLHNATASKEHSLIKYVLHQAYLKLLTLSVESKMYLVV